MPRFDNILQTVGNTPIVRLNKLSPPGVNIYVKVEAHNPMGSVKDRLALGIIEDAERRGELKPGQTVIEATSGNTGIGLAMVCAQRGYPLVVTMAENFSVERRKLMRFLGAKVILTPASEKGTGMLNKAKELAEKHGWFLCRQFENEANADVHSKTTAREIVDDFADDGLDYFVSGFGTGGTVKGIARVLKQETPKTQVVVCEPDNSPMLSSGITQARHADGSPAGSHPGFRPHLMQGWAPDFIPQLTEDAVNSKLIDQVVKIPGAKALELSRELARQEGIFVGISSGATLAGALELAKTAPSGSNILVMLPDTGERYLSTPLFGEIDVEMNAEELEISRSTLGYRFDICPTTSPEAKNQNEEIGDVDPQAAEYVSAALSDAAQPVVMFALEWCEFCWSVRKLFKQAGIPYRSVDLDSVELQAGDLGGKLRQALRARTECRTIPQIFVGGEFIGGCTDVFEAFKDGSLQAKIQSAGVSLNDDETDFDPYTLLPGWLSERKVA